MKTQKTLPMIYGAIAAGLIAVAVLGFMLKISTDRMDAHQDQRHESILLADELRQSSDDLTRLARTYVVTGDARYEKMYWDALAIRNGKKPRPENYERIYWDLVLDDNGKPRPDKAAVSLRESMERAGFTEAELAKLAEAQKNSDGLVETEKIAMNMVKGLYRDGRGNFTIKGPPDLETARTLMHDAAYHQAKASIMKPIEEFQKMLDDRTEQMTDRSYRRTKIIFWILQSIILCLVFSTALLFLLKNRQLQLELELSRSLLSEVEDRKRAEEARKESEERYRELFENANDIIFTIDLAGKFTSINKAAEKITGYTLEEALTMNISSVVAPEFLGTALQMLSRRDLGDRRTRFELEIVCKDGGRAALEFSPRVLSRDGKPVGIQGIARDTTERKRAEEKLRVSEEMFKVLSDQSPLGKALIDGQGRYEYVNPVFEAMFGYALQDLPTGAEWFRAAFPDPAKRKEAVKVWKEDLAHVGIGESRPRIFDVVCKGGVSKTILFRPVALEGNRQLVIYEDITERRRMEAQLQQATKMEAVGRLAGGVAHDFNNLLTVITGYSELLLQRIGKESPMRGELEEIQQAGERAASLTQQLLAFSRKQIIEPKVVKLDHLVAEMHKMLARLIGEDVALQATTGKSLGSVKIDPVQFQQILVNLVVNARDAMPGGGKIVIETANADLDKAYCATHSYVTPGRYVMLAVSDTGHGMSDDVKAHIFEPFFTTKERGKGTGLGLSTTYGAVKQSGGSIEAYSEVGIGTTFKIYLPRVGEEAAKPAGEILPIHLPGGTETVLLVEDEENVRNLGVRILKDLGYKVMQARNGDEALVVAMGCEERIDLLLTDVVMPGMSGSDLATRLVLAHPETKVLFTSGYTDDAIVHHGVLDEGVLFIGKPYSREGLARKVREVLDKA
jgi:two-component system cell cycle sensor histidine kinase/response regulator CckA